MKKRTLSLLLIFVLIFSLFSMNVSAANDVKFSQKNINLYVMQTYRLVLSGNTEKITYTSSDENIVSVSEDGVVTAVSEGSAEISATEGTTLKDKCTVKVVIGQTPEEITISDQSLTLTEGSTHRLKATVAPSDASDKSVYYSSSNKNVAEVDSKGNIKAVKEGNAVITVESASSAVFKKCIVKVTAKGVDSTRVNISGNLYSIAGEKKKNMIVEFKQGKKLTEAETDEEGKFSFEGVQNGDYTVNVYSNSKTKGKKLVCSSEFTVAPYDMKISCIINGKQLVILYQDQKVSSENIDDITLEKSTLMLDEGETFDMTYVVRPANVGTPTLRGVSSDESVATVDADGRITAVAQGKAKITFSTLDGKISRTCVVNVTSENSNENSWIIISVEVGILLIILIAFSISYRKFVKIKEKEENEEDGEW